jgi:AraC-like DNA-binding protein
LCGHLFKDAALEQLKAPPFCAKQTYIFSDDLISALTSQLFNSEGVEDAHYELSSDYLAEQVSISAGHLRRLFQKVMRVSLHQYVM